jgi:endoglucanase
MVDSTLELLRELTEAHGVPGYEAPIRAVVRKYLGALGEVTQDKIRSVICQINGRQATPKVMLAVIWMRSAMVKQVTKEGFIYFLPLGGWSDQVLLGQRVLIKTSNGDVVGVIGAKPPHLVPASERDKLVKKQDMYIDVGATCQEEVEAAGVRAGDPIVPQADFVPLTTSKTYMAKAFDNRVGTALVISTLQALKGSDHPNTVFGVATVMEEVGVRGRQPAFDWSIRT